MATTAKTAAQKAAEKQKKADEAAARKKALEALANGTSAVALTGPGVKKVLVRAVQAQLIKLACLDPKVDGTFGPQSQLALRGFATELGLGSGKQLTPKLAEALLDQTPATFRPIKPGQDLAGRIVRYMQAHKQVVSVLPGYVNIVYLEGAGPDGVPNNDAPDRWNDVRMILTIGAGGKPKIVFRAVATTEPGKHPTQAPENPDGVARIALRQFKAWSVGTHRRTAEPPRKHEGLIQVRPVTVFRDLDKNGKRKGDDPDTGVFGINQHSGLNAGSTVGDFSAGCLVGRMDKKHKEFMKLVKADPRNRVAPKKYVFYTTVIQARSLPE